MNKALLRFRVMAYIVGCWLLVLVGIAMPLKYILGAPEMAAIVSPIHGALYMVYMAATAMLGRAQGWTLKRSIGVMLAGTIPFVSFVVERRVVGWVQTAGASPVAHNVQTPEPVAS